MAEKILIVEDAEVNRLWLKKILEKSGYQVLEAPDGEEAVDLARTGLPDLIMMDVMMPNKDGYQACAELKADAATRDIPILFLSALNETEDKIRALELGAVDWVDKPFNRMELLARVKAHLRSLCREKAQADFEKIDRHILLHMSKGFLTNEEVHALAEMNRVTETEIRDRVRVCEQRLFGEVDSHLGLMARKGYVTKKELEGLAREYSLLPKALLRRVSVPVRGRG